MLLDTVIDDTLQEGISALPFDVNQTQYEQIKAYLHLLNRWNTVHNLTAIRKPREQVILHILDCLAILPFIPQVDRLADIGSGAGLPALVIALMRPHCQVYAVEANTKKAAFIRQAAITLGLQSVQVVGRRVQQWQPPSTVDIIVSRAMAVPQRLLEDTSHLGGDTTRWLFMCGLAPKLPNNIAFEVLEQRNITVPLLEATRTLLTVTRRKKR